MRAGMVAKPEDYRWCGYGEAVGGGRRAALAREGLGRALDEALRDAGFRHDWERYTAFEADRGAWSEKEPRLPQPPGRAGARPWNPACGRDRRRGWRALRHGRVGPEARPARRLAQELGGLGRGQGNERAARMDRGKAELEVRRQRKPADPLLQTTSREAASQVGKGVETVKKCRMTPFHLFTPFHFIIGVSSTSGGTVRIEGRYRRARTRNE